MKKVGLIVKNDVDAQQTASALETWLQKQNVIPVRGTLPPITKSSEKEILLHAPADLSCVFVLGGDGTFLSAIRWIGDQKIPVIGVKFGEVGFLAETTEDNIFNTAEAILNHNYEIEQRIKLQVQIYRYGSLLEEKTVLNEIVINKGALARLALIKTYINGNYLTTYKADGLIVATPTGSTAYSLAAGGPIIHPAVPGIIMTPICPFTLTNRPLIIPDSSQITIKLDKKNDDIMLTFDGQAGFEIGYEDSIKVMQSPHPVHIIKMPNNQYFDILKARLSWSGGRT